jgi:dolichyl-phosphate-mannose--protein O-mannosyl transferase
MLVPFAALIQYLPWAVVGRVMFLYHYLPVVPFLAIALGWWLTRQRRHRTVIMAAVAAAAVALFGVQLPMLEGWTVSTSYLDAVHIALRWVLPGRSG